MRYRYLDDFRCGISVFAIFSYGIAVLGTPQCPPLLYNVLKLHCFLQVIRINVDGTFIRLSGRKVCFNLFHGLRNLSFIAKELARAANEHKNETINDSP